MVEVKDVEKSITREFTFNSEKEAESFDEHAWFFVNDIVRMLEEIGINVDIMETQIERGFRLTVKTRESKNE